MNNNEINILVTHHESMIGSAILRKLKNFVGNIEVYVDKNLDLTSKSDVNNYFQKSFDNIAYLLYEQALIQEGVKLEDPSGFVNRLNNVIKETL